MKISATNEKVLEQFATMIIARMEQMQSGDWKKGWIGRSYGGSPVNIDGRNYSGSNTFFLLLDCALRGYSYPIYCTMKQANRLGCHINKGEKSMTVIFWDYDIKTSFGKKLTMDEFRNLSKSERDACTFYPFLKSYRVFNIDQTNLLENRRDKVEKLQSLFGTELPKDTKGMYKNPRIDSLLKEQSWVCPIEYKKHSDRAFYSPSEDKIVVPQKSQFKTGSTTEDVFANGQEFYSTLIHEMIHSTGTPERLNRQTGSKFGDTLYAKEELVAELGAARVGQDFGFDKKILDNNAAYLSGWISALKEEPKYILTLMGDVDKASRMVLEKLAS